MLRLSNITNKSLSPTAVKKISNSNGLLNLISCIVPEKRLVSACLSEFEKHYKHLHISIEKQQKIKTLTQSAQSEKPVVVYNKIYKELNNEKL